MYRHCLLVVALGLLFANGLATSAAHGQPPVADPPSAYSPGVPSPAALPQAPGAPAAMTRPARGRTLFYDTQAPSPFGRLTRRADDPTGKLLKALEEADDPEAERQTMRQLRDALDEQFEARMNQREKQIDDLEKRLEKLREQMALRRAAKSEIIDLRLQTIVNEAKGLGF